MLRNVEKRLKEAALKAYRIQIVSDIKSLQAASNMEIFKAASRLFITKWSTSEPLKEFCNYFEEQWLGDGSASTGNGSLFGWFEGYSRTAPSHNNATESTNRVIKDLSTFRERLPLKEFLLLIKDRLVRDWSVNRDPESVNNKAWSNEPLIELSDWTSAHQWLTKKKDVIPLTVGLTKLYFIPAGEKTQLCKAQVKRHIELRTGCKWTTFEEFVKEET